VPEHLYFACTQEDSEEYLEQGLYPLDRQMVHLSGTRLNALEAGRHIIGKPVVLLVDVRAAEEAGKPIMKAGTTVYVTNEVLASCLRKLPDSA
jgi:putative RNA 2'-phosphotransferase